MLMGKKNDVIYRWHEDVLYFQNLVVPKPNDRLPIIRKIHNEIVHFGEACTFSKVKNCFFLAW